MLESQNFETTKQLRRVSDHIPSGAWFIIFFEICERFTFYGVSGPLQNFIEFPYPTRIDDQPGALGKGQQAATSLILFFNFLSYITPILGAIIGDKYWGKYKTILFFSGVYLIGIAALILSAIPSVIHADASLPILIFALLIISMGNGGLKANVTAMVAEQYTISRPFIRKTNTGEKVIVDPNLTVQSIFHWFYIAISCGGLSPIITTNLEKYKSFWFAFCIPFLVSTLGIFILLAGKQEYVLTSPKGSILIDAFRVFQNRFEHSKSNKKVKVSESQKDKKDDDGLINDENLFQELQKTFKACQIFAFFPIFWISYIQTNSNLISQAATMQAGLLPNDFMNIIHTFALLICVPVLNHLFYPIIRKYGIAFGHVKKIFFGFMFAALGMAYNSIVQWMIYNTGPCYDQTLCIVDGKNVSNNISVWMQTPGYILGAISGAFACVTGLEYAYQKAPASMKSIVTSLFLLTTGIGAMLGFCVIPLATDPYSTYLYVILAILTFGAGCTMYIFFRKFDSDDLMIEEEEEILEFY
ncbi:hypothetical protein G9A89_001160 [Geosiphon pyriformis]|nr:hypothetical protein G9A89_001160 [Geosiphon pyriformis]